MTKKEFVSKAYEMRDAGRIEINGDFYYSEKAVLDAMEWMAERGKEIVEVDVEKIVENLTANLTNIMRSFEMK
jgi:hypothetical protein